MATPMTLLVFSSSLMVLIALGGFGISILLDNASARTASDELHPRRRRVDPAATSVRAPRATPTRIPRFRLRLPRGRKVSALRPP